MLDRRKRASRYLSTTFLSGYRECFTGIDDVSDDGDEDDADVELAGTGSAVTCFTTWRTT